MKNICLLFLIASFASCSTKKLVQADKNAILSIMEMQQEAWSKGEIEKFMSGYWQSEDLSFVGSRGPTYGWQTTLNNYKKSYPGKEGMGKLAFDVLQLKQLSSDTYYMIGKYNLIIGEETPSGYFTLVWKKIEGAWKIIADHSS